MIKNKTVQKLESRGNFLKMIKNIYEKTYS